MPEDGRTPELTRETDDWNRDSHPMTKDQFGVWEITVPPRNGQPAIPHNSKVKVPFAPAGRLNVVFPELRGS